MRLNKRHQIDRNRQGSISQRGFFVQTTDGTFALLFWTFDDVCLIVEAILKNFFQVCIVSKHIYGIMEQPPHAQNQ